MFINLPDVFSMQFIIKIKHFSNLETRRNVMKNFDDHPVVNHYRTFSKLKNILIKATRICK